MIVSVFHTLIPTPITPRLRERLSIIVNGRRGAVRSRNKDRRRERQRLPIRRKGRRGIRGEDGRKGRSRRLINRRIIAVRRHPGSLRWKRNRREGNRKVRAETVGTAGAGSGYDEIRAPHVIVEIRS